jgi:hypothetical protein
MGSDPFLFVLRPRCGLQNKQCAGIRDCLSAIGGERQLRVPEIAQHLVV